VAKTTHLSARGLTLARAGRTVCRDLHAQFEGGQLWAVLGRNGSGKSTLLHALCGLHAPVSGSVEIDGTPIDELSSVERARCIGILLQQDAGSFWGSVRDYAMLGAFPHGIGRAAALAAAQAALVEVGIAELAERDFDALSGGERQRVRIAQLLAQSPSVYCFDEPLAHLDLRHQIDTLDMARRLAVEGGHAVLVVLHEAHWAVRYCDHALLLGADGVATGGPAAGLLTRERLRELYDCDIDAAYGSRAQET